MGGEIHLQMYTSNPLPQEDPDPEPPVQPLEDSQGDDDGGDIPPGGHTAEVETTAPSLTPSEHHILTYEISAETGEHDGNNSEGNGEENPLEENDMLITPPRKSSPFQNRLEDIEDVFDYSMVSPPKFHDSIPEPLLPDNQLGMEGTPMSVSMSPAIGREVVPADDSDVECISSTPAPSLHELTREQLIERIQQLSGPEKLLELSSKFLFLIIYSVTPFRVGVFKKTCWSMLRSWV